MPGYQPLHVRSAYSLGRGTAPVEALAERAALYGHSALALTDRNALYGAVPFARACADWGVRPLFGAEVDDPDGLVVLLTRDDTGHAHMCRILTQRRLDPGFRLERELAAWGEGLHVLCADPARLARLATVVARGSLWGELAAPRRAGFAAVEQACAALGLETVATGDTGFLDRADHALHVTLSAIRRTTLAGRLGPGDLDPADAVFKAPAAMRSVFRERPRALANTERIAESCTWAPRRDRWIFPSLALDVDDTPGAYLRRRCEEGLARRYGGRPPAAVRRLRRELDVIERLGFTDYFVIVGDIVRFARGRGIATVGRGSGAGAITAYLLGITNVDPVRYGLSFERFLHEKRPDCPDLDVDLCWKRRDEVIEHVYRTYGRDRVAMISTHATFQARSAFREAARAHGVPLPTVNRLSRTLPRHADSFAEAVGAARGIPRTEAPWPRVLRDAERLHGLPRHLGVHPGGMVIADRPIDHYVPLERAAKGIVVTQYEMRAIESVGLVKMDLLGNRALSTIQETLELVEERTGTRLDPDAFPDPDPAVARLFTDGETLGVFQMESPGMRNLNRMLRTGDLATTIAAVALIRPGPAGSGMKERFVRRARGLEPVTAVHPSLLPVLRETYGMPLYEEDVMRMAAATAGVSPEDGDMIRRAIGEGRPEQREEIGRMFRRAARRRGLDAASAERVWETLLRFGAYAFCKAHAAGYGVLAYQAGWLKAHHPVEYTAALLNHHAGMYDKRTHLQHAQRRGVRVLHPCVNLSGHGAAPEGDAVRVGLEYVRGLAGPTREAVLAERRRRPFAGPEDLLCRVPATRPEVEALVLAGAFDDCGRTRPGLLCAVAAAHAACAQRRRDRSGALDLFDEPAPPAAVPPLPPFARDERLWLEWHVLGLCIGDHPVRVFRDHGALEGTVPAREAERSAGRRVRTAGIVVARRIVPTRAGAPMQFVTLEDESGLVECVLFPEVHRAHRGVVRAVGPYVVEGRVEETHGAPTLTVERMRPVEAPPALAAARRRVERSVAA